MGIKTIKVWLVAAACIFPWCAASLCPTGLQYWSNDSETCVNCSRCDASAKHVVIRPCLAHADTVCGPISDLNIDWSWLKPQSKHNGRKNHKHFTDLGDDVVTHRDVIGEEDEETVSKSSKHQGRKHHKHEPTKKLIDYDGLNERKHNRKHHMSSESLLSEGFDSPSQHKLFRELPPPPPLKSTDDLEREWKELLIQSKNRLQHKKDDLLKNLHEEESKPYNEKHHTSFRLNRPTGNLLDDTDTELFHKSFRNHEKHFSPLELELFDKLVSHQHQRLSISHLLSGEKKRAEDKDPADDLSYPMDSFGFRSVVPTHRLFLGEPSTVSEIMDQDLSEEVEDERFLDDKDPEVVAVPFTAAETLIWDWQAVALASAVAACLLFFSVVAVYSLLQARQWRRLKNNIDTDMEELSAKVGLMSGVGVSAAEGVNTNIYLENLLENKKKSSNIYTQKRPVT